MKYLLLISLTFASLLSSAQVAADSSRYDEVRSIINFYKYMLNTIGSEATSTRDKEVIITESFKKIFDSPQVQIEDDLTQDRQVITNKDVPAYLRDVDFFFSSIRFDFEDITIERMAREDSSFYYLASFESVLNGTTIDNQEYSSANKRFIEVNLDTLDQDLKIASVYSTKLSREAELKQWWNNLSFGWKDVFSSYVPFDSVTLEFLLKITSIDSLHIAENQLIQNLDPLTSLKKLKYLDIAFTRVPDLEPLRHAKHLHTLKASHTPIISLTGIQFNHELKYLDVSNSKVEDIDPLAGLDQLAFFDLSGTPATQFEVLKNLTALRSISLSNTSFDDATLLASNQRLETVNLSRTSVDHLFVFQSLPQIAYLDVSESSVANLNGLENHPSLREIAINQTSITELKQLDGLVELEKVQADLSGVSEETASVFMKNNPGTVVITNSAQLDQWWNNLSQDWKDALRPVVTTDQPTKEDLVKLINLDSLVVSDRKLYSTAPLKQFKRLIYLDVSNNDFTDFDFTEDMLDLVHLNASGLPIESTQGLEKNINLRQLQLNGSKLRTITALARLHQLEILEADQTSLSAVAVIDHLAINPNTVVIYQTEALKSWWKDLSTVWKTAFQLSEPGTLELHRLVEQKHLKLEGHNITSLLPLQAFINLRSLEMNKLRVRYLSELSVHRRLQALTYTDGPLQSLEDIPNFSQLESLNISNTAIEDLRPLYYLKSLKHLNCSGTGIKNFKGLDQLVNMKSMDVSNTRIWRLDRLENMSGLRSLVCYNTRLSQAKVDTFQESFPECDITYY